MPADAAGRPAGLAAGAGRWLRDHRGTIRAVQWVVVVAYGVLLIGPAFLPLPERGEHIWSNLTLFAQFVFWGLWWPFVLVSMVLVGRTWCGIFCPEGALTEFASRWSLGRHVPRWLTWGGWPFTAFVLTTVFGQMTSVYGYPGPALLVLGGSTLAAVAVGLVYGRDKRVWCRHLCPANGVFATLAKLAPVAFRADAGAWRASQEAFIRQDRAASSRPGIVTCAPLVAVRQMRGAGACHMCGRCQDFRGAVGAVLRSPNHDVVENGAEAATRWDSALVLFGLIGVALGAFHWSGSGLYVALKQLLADRLVEVGWDWPLAGHLPWWLLTNYPAQNDVMTPLDGFVLIAFMAGTALTAGTALALGVAFAVRVGGPWSERRFHHLVGAMIPVAGCGVFLGLSATTVALLKADAITIPGLALIRAGLLGGSLLWTLGLAWGIAGRWTDGARRPAVVAAMALPAAIAGYGWASLFWRI